MNKTERELPPSLIAELFSYDEETGDVVRRIDRGGTPAGSVVGCLRPDGYLVVMICKRLVLCHRVAWCLMHGKWPDHFIDHIDGSRANNRRANLRDVTQSKNIHNQHKRRRNALGVAGVCEIGPGRFKVQLKIKGRSSAHLGVFGTPEEAAEAYSKAKAIAVGLP